jgi:hypothetical protein
MSPTSTTGGSIVLENRNLLNIPMDVPEPPPPPIRRRPGHGQRNQSISASEVTGSTSRQTTRTSHTTHGRQSSSQQSLGLPEMFAKGLIDRGESLGINRTNILNAVSELRVRLAYSWVLSQLILVFSAICRIWLLKLRHSFERRYLQVISKTRSPWLGSYLSNRRDRRGSRELDSRWSAISAN